MTDQWLIRGTEFENCNCAWGCPCQFGANSTQGHCEAFMCGHIDHGNFNDTNLDGLDWAMVMYWPGEVHEGNGTQQVIIGDRADPIQREALRKILHGESTTPGTTHFFNYNSMMSTVLDTLYAPIEMTIDVDQRTASVKIDGLVESHGTPLSRPSNPRFAEPDTPQYTGWAALSSTPRWATATPQPGRGSSLTLFQLLPIQRAAHESGRADPALRRHLGPGATETVWPC